MTPALKKLLLGIFVLCNSFSFAQVLPDSTIQKIDKLFERWNNPNSPGCAIGIVRNDSLIYAKGYGLANVEYGVPITPETIFHVASVSKQFTAYALVLLAKQGRINLDDDIRKYLTWFPDLKEKITIRHLLHHTSGIRDQWQLLAISGTRLDDVIRQDHIVRLLGKQRALNFKPGDDYNYSNSGFTMAGEIVKAVTGKTLRQFCDSAIFKPLGMNSTHFHDDYTEIVKNRAYSYSRKDASGFSNAILSYSNAGATSLFTNVADMSKWLMNFYNLKVGTPQDLAVLTQRGKLNNGRQLTYALGISNSEYKGWTAYSHSGGDAGFRTFVTAFPELKMGFIVFSNLGDVNPVGKTFEIMDFFIKEKTAKAPTSPMDTTKTIDAIAWKKFNGDYISDAGAEFSFKIRNDKLYWDRYGRSDLLVNTSKDTFVSAQAPEVKFVFAADKKDTIAKQFWPDGQRVLVKYISDSIQASKSLPSLTGVYHCPELDVKYAIELKNNALYLTNDKYGESKLRLVGKDNLAADFWWMNNLRVLRNPKGDVIGFEVNSGRIMHLRFNKI